MYMHAYMHMCANMTACADDSCRFCPDNPNPNSNHNPNPSPNLNSNPNPNPNSNSNTNPNPNPKSSMLWMVTWMLPSSSRVVTWPTHHAPGHCNSIPNSNPSPKPYPNPHPNPDPDPDTNTNPNPKSSTLWTVTWMLPSSSRVVT